MVADAPTPDIGPDPDIVPDTKDWTLVLTRGCEQCGFDPAGYGASVTTPARLRATVQPWREALARDDVRERPAPATWSPLEYGAHVRDVNSLFLERLHLMLTDDDARFADWDQDAAAVAGGYRQLDPATVAEEYAAATETLARAFEQVEGVQWQRHGLRSNGAEFTVETFALYLLHDLEHHLHDVGAR